MMIPQKETPTACETVGEDRELRTCTPQSTPNGDALITAQHKRFSTLQARCAIAGGYVLRKLDDGAFLVTGHGGMCREFLSMDKIELWLAFVEGKRC